MKVIDCIESKDESVKSKAMYLLSKMCNSNNVQIIIDKLFNYLKSCQDEFNRQSTVTTIFNLCDRYAPNPLWFIKTMTSTLEISNTNVDPVIFSSLTSLLKEGIGDVEEDKKLISNSLDLYVQLLKAPSLPEGVVGLQAWILGEYLTGSLNYEIESILVEMISKLKKGFSDEIYLFQQKKHS